MANNKSQAQHLASLDFDISQLIETLRQVDEQTKAYGLQAGKNFYTEFQKGANETKTSSSTTAPKIVDEDSLKSATQQVQKLETEYGKLAKTVTSLNSSGGVVSQRVTYIDDNQVQTVLKYNSALKQTGVTITENTAKQEKQTQQTVSQIERMIEKQKQFNTLVSQQRTSSTNKDILNKSNQYIQGLEELKTQISSTGKVTEEQKAQLGEYGNKVKELSGYYQEAGTKGESFLQKISDKAKWLAAFYVVNEFRKGFVQAISTIKETEDAVVSLQRVLNDDTISQSRMTDELYDIAVEYGRTFDEVSEVAQQFVQAGYNWTDAVETTRGTMLALNTAELDVMQSTEGLIAIMAQWNLEAEDYADVIDKINITADNFAVTSEKIVAALQRSSSSAKNANISLEETIGIITALAEATGRSGENIGTALNSLIIYTSKSNSLETFAKNGSDAMKQVVEEYKRGAVSIYDVWIQLSEELSDLSASQQAALFNSEEYKEFANELESQAEEFTSQVKEIYGAAGTYRQNYFIALLNDMATAEEAVKGMADAEGYSLQENEKYMESLTANWNQLKSVLAELAVQLGEAGLLDSLKALTQFGISAAKFTKDVGGLANVLLAVGGAIILINQQKFSSFVADSISSMKDGVNAASAFAKSLLGISSAQKSVASSATLLQGAFGWIGIITTGISIAAMAITGFNNKMKEAQQEARNRVSDNLREAESLQSLKQEYYDIVDYTEDASEKTRMLSEYKEKLISQYGLEKDAIDKLNASRREEIDLLDEAYRESVSSDYSDIVDQYEQARKKIESSSGGISIKTSMWQPSEYDKLYEIFSQYGVVLKEIESLNNRGVGPYKYFDIAGETVYEQIQNLKSLNAELKSQGITIPEIQKEIEKLNEIITENQDAYNIGSEAVARYNVYVNSTFSELRDNVKDLSSFNDFKDALIEAADGSEPLIDAIETFIYELFPEFQEKSIETGETVAESFSISQESIDALKAKLDELNNSIDGFQSGFDTVISAIQEYNENGYLTVDTIQALISAGGEYVSMLQFTADGVSLNEEKVRNLMEAQKQNIDSVLAAAYAADVLRISEKYLGEAFSVAGDEAQESGAKISNLIPEIGDLIQAAWEGGDAAYHLAEGLAAAANKTISGSDMDAYQKELDEARQNWKNLGNEIQNSYKNSSVWSNKSTTSASNAAKEQTEAIKKELEAQKEAVKDRYDAEIQKLKDVQEENDRLQKQEEYYRNRQEALADIEKASTRSGVEYREQESEARQKLEELDREWQETVADWSIEDKISELEALRDAEVAAIDAQIDALSEKISNVGNSMVSSYSNYNQKIFSDYQNQYLEPVEDYTQKTYENIYSHIPEIIAKYMDDTMDILENNSKEWYEIYNRNFFSKMFSSVQSISGLMSSLSMNYPIIPTLPFSSGIYGSYNQNIVNNDTRNSNIFANVYNQNSADHIVNRIFTKP